jgi:hypothetical protein
MGIKKSHQHEEKECFVARSFRQLDQAGIFEFVHPTTFRLTRVAGAYMPYTGGFYLYDLDTGEEIAHFGLTAGREFFEQVIESHRVADLILDSDCKIGGTS